MKRAAAGDDAVLVELGEVRAEELHAAASWVRSLPGVVRATPGHSSLYVVWSSAEPPRALFGEWPRFEARTASHGEVRMIGVRWDGEDLAEFLAEHALAHEAFLARVRMLTLIARYIGFRAGFAYLDGWPAEWAMPRRATSRPVRRGAFAIAGNVAGFYPIDSPGGWNVLGHTEEDLVHAIEPGERIRLGDSMGQAGRAVRPLGPIPATPRPFTLVNSPLALETSAPFDELLGALAARAVEGNVALIECAFAGPRVRFHDDAVVAWCDGGGLRVERVRGGVERAFGRVQGGLRGYLAIGEREGVAAEMPERGERHVLHAVRGPHDVGLDEVACDVTPQLDRVGIRLRPLRELRIAIPADLRSIGMQCGTVQLHPDGSLVAMGPDHPVTGGYLQPMTVINNERWKLAQLMPGERIVLRAAQPPNW